ncbi:MAG TPA: hypothetical protein VFW25_08155 [Silvibacterium sp.]|nr:hypothetical protein [Silvibacterium sp.]
MKLTPVPLLATLLFASLVTNAVAYGQQLSNFGWHSATVPFRVIAVSSDGSSIWACGADEGIAVSSDGGTHWQLKHQSADGNLLLGIQFVNSKMGYAAGTGGLILMTEDGGESWTSHAGPNETILQISFSDPEHGLIRTIGSLESTVDGGKNWSPIAVANDPDVLKKFPYTYSLAALDGEHMAVMLKEGAAQYESQTFLVTDDAGKSWRSINVPNVTLYSFLPLHGKYWAVGTEVVGKDRPGGGHGVPVALYSGDGVNWVHSTNDLSACGPEMCTLCTTQGCLSSNGTITDFFGKGTTYRIFPSEPKLTTKWAATDSAMCFAGSTLLCSGLTAVDKPAAGRGPMPVRTTPGPLGIASSQGPHCISCGLDRILVDPKAQGTFTIKLSLDVARDGTVTTVEVDGAPTPEIKSRIEQQVQQWLFEPYMKDGMRVNLKLNTRIQVNVIHPR